jgi:hypothetical protein
MAESINMENGTGQKSATTGTPVVRPFGRKGIFAKSGKRRPAIVDKRSG